MARKKNHKIIESLLPLAVEVERLKLDPRNARLHPDPNMEAIRRSLESYGQRKPIVVNSATGVIEAGNGLFQAAVKLGWTHVAAVMVDDDEVTAKGYALMDNKSALSAEWDFPVLKDLLQELDTGAFDMDLTGFNQEEIEKLMTYIPKESGTGDSRGDVTGFDKFFVFGPKWNKKRSIKFLSIYSYRAEYHEEGARFLKTVKKEMTSIGKFAEDISNELKLTFQGLEGLTVTNCPRGHSRTESHYAAELSKAVAKIAGLKYESIFKDRDLKGTSNPRNYASRRPVELKGLPTGGIILVDDVATSGTTLEACLKAIDGKCLVIPIVLIYEDSAIDED
jgi:hypothetical protein